MPDESIRSGTSIEGPPEGPRFPRGMDEEELAASMSSEASPALVLDASLAKADRVSCCCPPPLLPVGAIEGSTVAARRKGIGCAFSPHMVPAGGSGETRPMASSVVVPETRRVGPATEASNAVSGRIVVAIPVDAIWSAAGRWVGAVGKARVDRDRGFPAPPESRAGRSP